MWWSIYSLFHSNEVFNSSRWFHICPHKEKHCRKLNAGREQGILMEKFISCMLMNSQNKKMSFYLWSHKPFPRCCLKRNKQKRFSLCREGSISVLVYVDVSSSPAGGWQYTVSNCTTTLLKLTCEKISCIFRTQSQTETTTFTSANGKQLTYNRSGENKALLNLITHNASKQL